MKKKMSWILGCVVILAGIGIITFPKKEIKENHLYDKENNLAIMVSNGSSYIKQDAVPIGSNYSLNEEKTYCEGGSIVKDYDSVNGTIKHILNGNDQCYVYFDKQLTLSETVIAKTSEEDYSSSQDGTPYRVIDQNGIRYEGADPDNYVYYNCDDQNDLSTCEKWRIIGVFDGSDMGLEPGKKYTKIIRGNVFNTKYAIKQEVDYEGNVTCPEGYFKEYDDVVTYCYGSNDWIYSPIRELLNENYLNQTGDFVSSANDKGLSTTAREMIAKHNDNYSIWYLGYYSGDYSINNFKTDWYQIERGNSTYGVVNDAIALMYPSDHGYAMYAGKDNVICNNASTYKYYDCQDYNWINLSVEEWLIISDGPENPMVPGNYSVASWGIYKYDSFGSELSVRPTLYLSSDVLVNEGNGSKDNPYQISL